MAERGTLLARASQLPENRFINQAPVAAPQAPPVAPFFDLPKDDQDFAYVEGITDKFYDTKGKIEAYALDMQKRYGVDVTQPDYTQPGGGIAFKTYQKLAADLMLTANDLKTSMTRQKGLDDKVAANTFRYKEEYDPTQQPSSRMDIRDIGYSTDLDPEVTAANEILDTEVYTQADAQRFNQQVRDPLIADYEQRKIEDPRNKERYQIQIDALKKTIKKTPYSAFQSGGGGAKKPTVEIDILKDTTNLAQGVWKEGNYELTTNEEGEPIAVNKKREGEQYGEYVYEANGAQKRVPRIIDKWVREADGSVYLEFKQQDGIDIPREKVSDKRGDSVASSLISSNPKYGSVPKMYEAAREEGFLDDTSSAINEKLVSPEAESIRNSQPLAQAKEAIDKEKNRIRTEIKNLPIKFTGTRPGVKLKSRDGDAVVIKKGVTGKYYIESISKDNVDLIKKLKGYKEGDESKLRGIEIVSGLTEDELMDYLATQADGYFNQFIPTAKKQSSQKQPSLTPGGLD